MPLIAAYPAAAAAATAAARLSPAVSRLMRRLGKGKTPPSSVPRSGPQVRMPTDSGVSGKVRGMVRRGVGAARNPALREPDQIAPEDVDAPLSPVNIRELYKKINKELKQLTLSSKKPPIPTRKPKLASGLVIPTRKPKNRG
jgi:hypothetical protein|tara:strand:- start:690 stop:1115 length:426 start_codon:yes stop_codon:yes gene_type:complete